MEKIATVRDQAENLREVAKLMEEMGTEMNAVGDAGERQGELSAVTENKKTGIDAYREELRVVLRSKLDEFHMLGYDRVTENELWECLKSKKWKRLPEELRIYQLVNDVLTLSANDYMTYLTMQAYKEPLWMFEEYENQ